MLLAKPVPVHSGRAHTSVKAGGFSLGQMAATNRGQLQDLYHVEPKVIGEGSYGTVQRCQLKETEQWRAIKTIHKNMSNNPSQFQEEVEILKRLDHPNIIRLHETFEDEQALYLVLELCTGGELFDRIVAEGKFTEQAAAVCVQQMLCAVNYLHRNFIMHRDLKPENWLFAAAEDSLLNAVLKLIDFGLSKRFEPGEFASTRAGTPYYVAPEVLDGQCTERSDVWSIGVITYVLLSGMPPFGGANTASVLQAVRRAEVKFEPEEWEHISLEARDLVCSLLVVDPSRRSDAFAALQHPWLRRSSRGGEDQGPLTTSMISNLRSFAAMNKLKKAALNVVASELHDKDIIALKATFQAMDTDHDGTLTLAELVEGLNKAGSPIAADVAGGMLHSLDTDGSGVVDYSEFLSATLDRQRYQNETLCRLAFDKFDLDGSGSIDRKELRQLLKGEANADPSQALLTEKEVNIILKEVDTDSDGTIDFKEFMVMMRHVPPGVRAHPEDGPAAGPGGP